MWVLRLNQLGITVLRNGQKTHFCQLKKSTAQLHCESEEVFSDGNCFHETYCAKALYGNWPKTSGGGAPPCRPRLLAAAMTWGWNEQHGKRSIFVWTVLEEGRQRAKCAVFVEFVFNGTPNPAEYCSAGVHHEKWRSHRKSLDVPVQRGEDPFTGLVTRLHSFCLH